MYSFLEQVIQSATLSNNLFTQLNVRRKHGSWVGKRINGYVVGMLSTNIRRLMSYEFVLEYSTVNNTFLIHDPNKSAPALVSVLFTVTFLYIVTSLSESFYGIFAWSSSWGLVRSVKSVGANILPCVPDTRRH